MTHLLHAIRGLRKNPAFTVVALASLALGIGANTAIFSVMDAVRLRTLGVHNPNELALLGNGTWMGVMDGVPDQETHLFSVDFAKTLAAKTSTFSGVAWVASAKADVHMRFGDGADFEKAGVRLVSGSYFGVLGVGPALGRVLAGSDDLKPGAHPLAVMSYEMWDRRFNFDPGVLNRTMTLNGRVYTIIGIAGRGFKGTHTDESTDFWIPLAMGKQVQAWVETPEDPTTQFLIVFGRRKPGVSLAEAQANTNFLFKQWVQEIASRKPAADRPADMAKVSVELTPLALGISQFRHQYTDPLWILAGVAGMVLLIACANLANLLLARGNGRRREIAVRLALGASRARLIWNLLVESAALSLAGGALGVIVAWWGSQYLLSMVSRPDDPLAIDSSPNWHVLVFTLLISLITGVLFGIAPSIRATRVDPGPALKEGKGSLAMVSRTILSKSLVAAQVALALVLTTGAGLLISTLTKLESKDPGFRTERAYVVQFDVDSASVRDDAYSDMARRIESRIKQTPGVVDAGFSSTHFGGGRNVADMRAEGGTPETINSDANHVDGSYFAAIGMQLVAGRTFGVEDASKKGESVAIVNETLARKFFPTGEVVGKRFYEGRANPQYFRIVGIVRDAQYFNLRHKERPMFYLNAAQTGAYSSLVVRVAGDAAPVMDAIRGIVHDEDRNLAIARIDPLRELVDRTLNREKLMARLAGFFAAVALLLAAIGLYGILAYAVSQRTSEIGIRMALGARPGDVQGMILRESLVMVGLGICIGIPVALASGKLIESQLFGMQPRDPMTMALASLVMLTVAMAASLLPARRAARLDPIVALRNE